mmetsp:Transcript_31608/g.97713  ORF Transcript_31608/g.97713 Transcript_31608/m.97713 type:complete len:183 (+) Transcript_31608:297-845(+)
MERPPTPPTPKRVPQHVDDVPRQQAQVYSAHAAIAIYRGTSNGVARFETANYLRYAVADTDRAVEPRHELLLNLGDADAHVAAISQEVEGGAISRVVAALPPNQRVELEFLQMRLPGLAPDEGWVFVVPKLAPVTAAEERALVARWCRQLKVQGSFLAPHPLPAFCQPCAPPPPPPGGGGGS